MNSLMFLVLVALMVAGGIAAPIHNSNSLPNNSPSIPSNSANATTNTAVNVTVTAVSTNVTVLNVTAIHAIYSVFQEITELESYTVRH